MPRRVRTIGALAFLSAALTGAAAAAAQPTSRDPETARLVRDVNTRLASGDPQQVAWGSFLAAYYGLGHAVPALSSALVATPDAGAYILDALIQLRASLPASQLLATYSRWPIQSLILIGDSRHERDEVLLELFKAAKSDQWFAIANLLNESRSPGLPLALLRETRFKVHVTLVSDDNHGAVVTGGGMFGSVGCGIDENPAGYPPLAYYRFTGAQRGAVVLANGPHPIYYTRLVAAGGAQFDVSTHGDGSPTDRDRVAYLAAIAGFRDEDMPVRVETWIAARWTDQQALDRELAAQRADIESRYRRLLERLVNYKRLSAADAEWLKPAIDVEITDRRK